MSIPSPWIALILIGASYRLWRLLAEDTIFDRPRNWLVGLPPEGFTPGSMLPEGYRFKVAELINCAWCSGAWITIAVWALWQVDEHWTAVLATPFALSAGVGLIRVRLDPPEAS